MNLPNSTASELVVEAQSTKIAVAIACFNRRDTTLACIGSLIAQQTQAIQIDVYILDDGSTDGTSAAVQFAFPEVQITQGSGSLFWGGGMNAAMSQAMARHPEFVLMLNDDVALFPNAIGSALADYEAAASSNADPKQIIVGATTAPGTSEITYSGFRRTNRLDPSKIERVPPDQTSLRACDTMNGNFVLLPCSVFANLGPVDPAFVHQLGDLDYGYRARKIGANIWIAKQPVGECSANTRIMPFEKPNLTLAQRWTALNSPLGLPLKPWLVFMWRHGGIYGVLRLFGIYVARMLKR